METRPEGSDVARRDVLLQGAAAAAGLALLHAPGPARAFPARAGEEVIAWADQPPPHALPAVVPRQLRWEELGSWLTPNDKFFLVGHYGFPAIEARDWTLKIGGMVRNPLSLTLDEIKARPRQEVVFTLECSGNHGFPFMTGVIGTAKWAGTPLAPILQQAGIADGGVELVFSGADLGEDRVRDAPVQAPFARSLSLADATRPEMLLCYEMNGAPLPRENGFPLRLIAPGFYGVANVKWLNRIEVLANRFAGRFMARDYVTIRDRMVDGQMQAMETTVGPVRLKSAPARVTRAGGQYRIVGVAWGGPIARVEVRIDNGAWMPASIDRSEESQFAWLLWSLDWTSPAQGEHTIVSRAIDTAGQVQPAMDDPWIANKRTYWESNGQVSRTIRID